MGLLGLSIRNIRGNFTRSLSIFLCVMLIAGFFITTTLIIQGSQYSLKSGIDRLGADVLVVPKDAEPDVESAILMGKPTQVWMSQDYLQKIKDIPGVAAVSPQIYLQSLFGASCCSVSETFLVVYDPATDFTVTPWLQQKLGRPLATGEIIGGCYIFVPPGEDDIKLYGYHVKLAGNLEPTGTGIDQTIFMTEDTARAIAAYSTSKNTTAVSPLVIPSDQISSVLLKVSPGTDPHAIAQQIMFEYPEVTPIERLNLFGTFRQQMLGLLWIFVALLAIAWVISVLLIGLVFFMAASERRREMAVLRALGATRSFILRIMFLESSFQALAGGLIGILLSSTLVYMFKNYISYTLNMPFLFPSIGSFLVLAFSALVLSVSTVILAVFIPVWKISRQEPAMAMRE